MGIFDKLSALFKKEQGSELPSETIPQELKPVGATFVPDGDGGFTVNLNQPQTAVLASRETPVWQEPKLPEVSEEENPEYLTRDLGLGSHHVNGGHIHIGMSVRYVADTHTVVYTHWSTEDPEETKTYPIPVGVRTKAQLLWYLERKTDIPSVCWHPY